MKKLDDDIAIIVGEEHDRETILIRDARLFFDECRSEGDVQKFLSEAQTSCIDNCKSCESLTICAECEDFYALKKDENYC